MDTFTIAIKKFPFYFSERDSNLPVRSGEGLTVDPDGPLPGNPSPNCSPRTPASATRSASGDSATAVDPSSEIPSSSSQGGNRPGEADIPIISIAGGDSAMDTSTGNPHTDSEGGNRPGETGTPIISSAGGDSADSVSPINSGEKDCPVSKARNTLDARRATGDSSEEESPIRNIRG